MAKVEYNVCDRCGEKINYDHKKGAEITYPRRIKIIWRLFQYLTERNMELCGNCAEGLEDFLHKKETSLSN